MLLYLFLVGLTIFLQATADGAAGLPDAVPEHGIAGIIGIILPLIVAALRRPGTPTWLSIVIALAVSVVTGVIGLVVAGKITAGGIKDPGYILTAAALAFTEATIIYQTWFRTTDANRTLQEFPKPLPEAPAEPPPPAP